MGYTHCWTFKAPKRGETAKVNKAYKTAIHACQKMLIYWNEIHAHEPDQRLSGYSAHVKPGTYGGLKFNGARENAHEDFVLREHYKQNLEPSAFNFCKTARKPYDVPVTACLAILKHYLGDYIELSTDGKTADWSQGVGLAKAALNNLKIKNPLGTGLRNVS